MFEQAPLSSTLQRQTDLHLHPEDDIIKYIERPEGKATQTSEKDGRVGQARTLTSRSEHASAAREERHLVTASTEVSIVRQALDTNTEESHLQQKNIQENLAEDTFGRKAAEFDCVGEMRKSQQVPGPPATAPHVLVAPLGTYWSIQVKALPIVEGFQTTRRAGPQLPRAAVLPVTTNVPRFRVTNLGQPAPRPATRRKRQVEGGGQTIIARGDTRDTEP